MEFCLPVFNTFWEVREMLGGKIWWGLQPCFPKQLKPQFHNVSDSSDCILTPENSPFLNMFTIFKVKTWGFFT